MAAGKFNMQANDGAVIGLIVPDGLTSGERQISLGEPTGFGGESNEFDAELLKAYYGGLNDKN